MKTFLAALLLTTMVVVAPVRAAECVKLAVSSDSDYAPLHWYDGRQLTGASIEIARRVLTALEIPFEVRYVGPFHRVLKEAESGDVAMVASLKNTPERQKFLSFTSVPLFSNPISVFVASDRRFAYAGWQDLIGKRGAITQGNQFGGPFDDFLRAHLTIQSAQKAHMNFTRLDSGQVDYFITGYYNGMIYLNQSGQADHFVALQPYVSETDNFLALSNASPCVKHLARINAQLELMQKRGELRAVLERYAAQLKVAPHTAGAAVQK
ncbi:substrate-binding periplasmic protein [Herbaspirillum sp. alder98]|uniref:substrate-binding periplasmic protein n=1 Tax=Herbaspirillum sp. alder98 TaxID=2913096 RepID=UPI001CD827D1|nr:transporter substrate-binding domain-containing protein [Herbaspirillum sp. alder98]MCA1326277.1 transporter substrate-binding domain-containing protein [Herbaspirillum sp. alder98]